MGFDGEEDAGRASEKISWQAIQKDAAAHRRTDALFAAVQLGLFDVIRERPTTVDEASTTLRTSLHRTRALLDLLVAYGYLRRENGEYCQPADLLPLTDPERADNLQKRFAYPTHTRRSWADIATALREDRSVRDFGDIHSRSPQLVTDCHASIGSLGYLFIEELVDAIGLPHGGRILDVGGGFGDLCRPFLERDPQATAVVFEAPDTVELALRYQRQLGLTERLSTVGGDFEIDELPGGFDLLIVSSVLQFYDDSGCSRLVTKFRHSLRPGGRILVREIKIDEGRTGPLSGLEFSLHMAINSERGHAYPQTTMRSLLEAAGFSEVSTIAESPLFYVMMGANS